MDLLRDHPVRDPVSYAYDYYAKYPALTILFYPPLFYFFLAAFYAVLGVSQQSALCAEFVCYVALTFGAYRLARFWLPTAAACAAAAILAVSPEVAYWGRQVMLEIPAFAVVTWSAVFFMLYLREGKTAHLFLSAFLLVLSVYTKTTSVFMAGVYLAALVQHRGIALFRDWKIGLAVAAGALMLVPLAVLTIKFGQQNIQSVAGVPESPVSRLSLAGWVWYARQIPSQLGYIAVPFAVLGTGLIPVNRDRLRLFALPFCWLVIGYFFFSAIDLKEARHDVFLMLPLSIFAAAAISYLLASHERLRVATLAAVAVATLVVTLMTRPVEYVLGYDDVADFVAGTAPAGTTVAFSGYRDGAFIFAMRAHETRRDISIVRADKLLLNVAIARERFVEDKHLNELNIEKTLDALGVRYVVAQPGFWTDLPSMRRLELLLQGRHFKLLKRFPMGANYHAQERELVVYQNLGRVAPGPVRIRLDIPTIGRSIAGEVRGQR
jgi:4-amino-4-deoxy-L-arabinose transferase-like glycosyltransferase